MLTFRFNGLLKQVALNLNQGSCLNSHIESYKHSKVIFYLENDMDYNSYCTSMIQKNDDLCEKCLLSIQ